MKGLMMETPLLISSLMRFADVNYPEREIVSVTVDNPSQRYTYREAFARTRKLANALATLGIESGNRIGTLAWNDHRQARQSGTQAAAILSAQVPGDVFSGETADTHIGLFGNACDVRGQHEVPDGPEDLSGLGIHWFRLKHVKGCSAQCSRT